MTYGDDGVRRGNRVVGKNQQTEIFHRHCRTTRQLQHGR
jgi:hypothetical protein